MFSKTVKWLKDNKEIVLFIFFSFLAWRVWLQVFLWLGWFLMPLGDKYLGGGLKHFLEHPGLWAWANFDGEHYLAIAQHGYGRLEQAFFPFYPFLMKTFVFSIKESPFALLISGLTISHLAFLAALMVLYFLIRLDFDKKATQWAIIFLLVFPTSFFFGAVYNESLFLALVLGSFYAARKGKWWLAGILGALASATRLVGILLLPALLWEWWEQNNLKFKISNLKLVINLLPIFLVPLGLIFYMRFLSINYQDPLMFMHVQPSFGAQRVVEKIVLPYQVFWRYFKMIADTKGDPLFFTVWLEFLTAIVFIVLIIVGYLRKVRVSYLIFAVLSFFLPSLTGTFSSLPRYALVLFPCFMTLALVEKKGVRFLWVVVNILILAMATILFTRGYFVA